MSIDTGKKIVNSTYNRRNSFNQIYNSLEENIKELNEKTAKLATNAYNSIILTLKTTDYGLVDNNSQNIQKVGKFVNAVEVVQNAYRKNYGELIRSTRKDSISLINDKNKEFSDILKEEGIKIPDKFTPSKNTIDLLNEIHKQGFRKVDDILRKWKNFAYDNFVDGVLRSLPLNKFQASFFQPNGHIRIGSSLDEESHFEAMRRITEERTAYHRAHAKENGWKCCYNANPMDRRTKPICMKASLAGVISEDKMAAEHGFPPRFICRCEIVFTNCEWTDINQGINLALEARRIDSIKELEEAPKKKAWWYNKKGKRITPADSEIRRTEMYQDTKDKMAIVKNNEVPSYAARDLELTFAVTEDEKYLKDVRKRAKTTQKEVEKQIERLTGKLGITNVSDKEARRKILTERSKLEMILEDLKEIQIEKKVSVVKVYEERTKEFLQEAKAPKSKAPKSKAPKLEPKISTPEPKIEPKSIQKVSTSKKLSTGNKLEINNDTIKEYRRLKDELLSAMLSENRDVNKLAKIREDLKNNIANKELVWKKASNLKEVKEQFKIFSKQVLTEFSENSTNLEYLNAIGEDLTMVFNKFPSLRQKYFTAAESANLNRIEFYSTGETGRFGQWDPSNRNLTQFNLFKFDIKKEKVLVGKVEHSSVEYGPRYVFRHEFGHHMHISSITKPSFKRDWKEFYESKGKAYFEKNVSKYAATNELEAMAESFAAYTSSEYKKGMLPKEIEDFIERLMEV